MPDPLRNPPKPPHPLTASLQDARRSLFDFGRRRVAELQEHNSQLAAVRQRLSEERDRYSQLFDLSPDAYIVSNRAGQIQVGNRAAGWLLRTEADALVGQQLASFVAAAERPQFEAELPDALRPRPQVWEVALQPADSEPVQVSVLVAPIGEEPGDDQLLLWVLRDLTEQKHAERRARDLFREHVARAEAEAAAERFHFLAEASRVLTTPDVNTALQAVAELAVPVLADACVICLLNDDGSMRCLAPVLADGEHRPEHEPAAVVGMLTGAPAKPHSASDIAARVMATGRVELHSSTGPAPAGSAPPFHPAPDDAPRGRAVLVVPLTAASRVIGILGLAVNSSGRRYNEDDIEFAEEIGRRIALALDHARLVEVAQQAARARDQMAALVSHDLRNPLNAILTYADLMLGFGGEEGTLTVERRQIRAIERAAVQMQRLIEDLLDSARLDGGSFPLERELADVLLLLDEALDTLAPQAEAAGLELRTKVEGALPPLPIDRERMMQVLANLIGNAIKFTPPGGTVQVAVRALAKELEFAVSDTGPGIPSADLAYVFDRFWQPPGAHRGGAGLGLSIAKGIVEGHGGRVWVESREGSGTTFFFAIPVEPIPLGAVQLEL